MPGFSEEPENYREEADDPEPSDENRPELPNADGGIGSALPSRPNNALLSKAIARIKNGELSTEEAAEEYELDRDVLESIFAVTAQFEEKRSGKPPEFTPRKVRRKGSRGERKRFTENWEKAADGVEIEETRSTFEELTDIIPPLRWFFGTERKAAISAAIFCVSIAVALALQSGNRSPSTKVHHTAIDPNKLTAADSEIESAKRAAIEFLCAESAEERLKLVRHADRLGTTLLEWRGKRGTKFYSKEQLSIVGTSLARFNFDRRFAVISFLDTLTSERFPVSVALDQGNYRVDWESFVVYSPKTWSEVVALPEKTAFPFRCRYFSSDYYNHPFTDPDLYSSYKLQLPGEDREIYGFVERDNPLADELLLLLGKSHDSSASVVLRLRPPADSSENAANVAKIESIEEASWIIPDLLDH